MNQANASIWHRGANNLMIVTTAKGMASLLSIELTSLGCNVSGATETGVSIWGDMYQAMRLNLQLRTAHRILWRLGEGIARHPDDLLKSLVRLPWEQWIPPRGYVCVTASGQSATGDDPRFVALKTKDAIMDRMSGIHGSRPDSGPERNRTVIHIHWESRHYTVYLDTAGESLSHRGYRQQPHKAPMRETLAAACLIGAEWKPGTALVNPMCGGGTLAIEAALMASHTPPGFLRTSFGFMHAVGYDDSAWKSIRAEESRSRLIRPNAVKMIATDHDAQAIAAAKANAERAGVSAWIEFVVCDYTRTPVPAPPGLVIFNPEYGERLGKNDDLSAMYKGIGDFMKQQAQGYTGAVFTGNAEMIKAIGLKPRIRVPLYNGPIYCRLLVFDLFDGTKRDRRLRNTDGSAGDV